VGTSSVNCESSRRTGTASNIATTETQDSHVTQTLPHFRSTELQPLDYSSVVATFRIPVNPFCIQNGYIRLFQSTGPRHKTTRRHNSEKRFQNQNYTTETKNSELNDSVLFISGPVNLVFLLNS